MSITTGWGRLHTLDLNIVRSFSRYAVHDPGRARLWKIVSIIGGPTVLRIAAVLVAVAIGGPAALSSIIKCWSTGGVNLTVSGTIASYWPFSTTYMAVLPWHVLHSN